MPTNMTGIDRKYLIDKAVEFDKCPKDIQKKYGSAQGMADSGDYIGQPKLDGCNGILVVQHVGGDYGCIVDIYTRTGELVRSCEHIREAAKALPSGAYLGELYNPLLDQPTISGMVRKKKEQCPELQFHVFDHLTLGEWTSGESDCPFVGRHASLAALCDGPHRLAQGIYLVPTFSTKPENACRAVDVEFMAANVSKYGQDGVILRLKDGGWEACGCSRNIVKVKPCVTLDLRVVGIYAGEGKHAGRAGGFLVRYKGKDIRVGTGLSDAQREEAVKGTFQGTIWEVEALGYTPDGMLREPRLKGQRFDKEEADAC